MKKTTPRLAITALITAAVLFSCGGKAAAQWDPFAGERPGLTSAFSTADDGLDSRTAALSAGVPLGSAYGFKLRAGAGATRLDTSGAGYFPGELYKEGLSLNAQEDGLRAGITVNSDSDKPFYSRYETNLGFNITKELPDDSAHGVWLLGLNYSTRRSFWRAVPMPFISYRYVSDKVTLLLPFMVLWRPEKNLSFSASWQPVKYYKLGLSWKASRVLTTELEGGNGMQQFFLAGRADKNSALYLQSAYVTLKPVFTVSKRLDLTPSFGWQFRGLYYTGDRYDDYRDTVSVKGGAVLGLSAKYRF
jgi:hypothetical protein